MKFEYEINGKSIELNQADTIRIQLGFKRGRFKHYHSFDAKDMARALMIYNGINIGNGYKKRLVIGYIKPKVICISRSFYV